MMLLNLRTLERIAVIDFCYDCIVFCEEVIEPCEEHDLKGHQCADWDYTWIERGNPKMDSCLCYI